MGVKRWRKDIESGSMDRLLDAAWEMLEYIENADNTNKKETHNAQ